MEALDKSHPAYLVKYKARAAGHRISILETWVQAVYLELGSDATSHALARRLREDLTVLSHTHGIDFTEVLGEEPSDNSQPPFNGALIEYAGFVHDAQLHWVVTPYSQDHAIHLTPLESRILGKLIINPGHILPTDTLINSAWGWEVGNSKLIKTHVSHLRQIIDGGRNPSQDTSHICSVPSVGYGFFKTKGPRVIRSFTADLTTYGR